MPGITLDNVQEKLWDGEVATSNSMGSNFYTRALRGAPSRSQPETPMPPDRMTGFNPGPWNPHPGLSTWCVPGKRLQLTTPYSLRKTCGSTGRKWMGMWFDSRWHWSQIDWHKTGMPQQCHLTHTHAITWPCTCVSNNIWVSETYFPLTSMKIYHSTKCS